MAPDRYRQYLKACPPQKKIRSINYLKIFGGMASPGPLYKKGPQETPRPRVPGIPRAYGQLIFLKSVGEWCFLALKALEKVRASG